MDCDGRAPFIPARRRRDLLVPRQEIIIFSAADKYIRQGLDTTGDKRGILPSLLVHLSDQF
jgi:hypothetical protein